MRLYSNMLDTFTQLPMMSWGIVIFDIMNKDI